MPVDPETSDHPFSPEGARYAAAEAGRSGGLEIEDGSSASE